MGQVKNNVYCVQYIERGQVVSSESKSEWFNLLRMAGAVTTTSSPAMFNVSYGRKKKDGKKTRKKRNDRRKIIRQY